MSNSDDFVGAGFKLLDVELSSRPPRIQWGLLYGEKSDAQKIAYLEKLAASMNQAAARIQDERDRLGRLCELKEAQLAAMDLAVRRNNEMLQAEITRTNMETQGLLSEMAALKARLRELGG